jgi:hypothetical protein
LASLEGGIAPELFGATLLFAHRPERATRYVALRFRDDATLHVYGRQVQNAGTPQAFTLFALTVDLSGVELPRDGRLYYRMAVDGIWMTDPANPNRERDEVTGLQWSVVSVDPERVQPPRSPQWLEGGLVRFQFHGEPGRTVALVGDFNGWDPYMHSLSETEPGRYNIELKLPPGPQAYVFSVDGIWTQDPLNLETGLGRDGRAVSVATRAPARGNPPTGVAARGAGAATR